MYNRSKVHQYIEYVLSQFEDYNIVKRLQHLLNEVEYLRALMKTQAWI